MVRRSGRPRRLLAAVVVGAVLLAAGAVGALGNPLGSSAPSIPTGQTIFSTVGCSACHTFRFARATGKIGPNLDRFKLTRAQIIKQITNGGCAVMSKAACSKYKFPMAPFRARLSRAQIADVAAFVYADRNKAPTGPPVTTTPSGTTTTTTSATTTTPTTTTGPPSECPPGTTIQTSGNTDGDTDETGQPTDFDGCL